jgi:hypothetical protein
MKDDVRTEGAHVDDWRETVIAAIEATRPAGERWSVTATEVADGVVTIDFARNADPPRSITLARPGGTTGRVLLFRMACHLLRREPGALEVH